MRLHALRVTAFGPFAETVEVDFDEVSAAGLFLIQGPTGAGKTSLLDAVAYALYAGLPGARRGSQQLRSDHASSAAVPEVRLDFTTGRRRFRVTRSPEFLRPKKRGDGTTKAPASVLLEEQLAGTWVMRSTRADEVGEIVTEMLGMGLEQFSKVVLLPQGEFAAFLRADAEERRTLLERLFDISTWAGVEDWLVEQRRSCATALETARSAVATDLARLRDLVATLPAHVTGDLDLLAADAVVDEGTLPGSLAALRSRSEEYVGETLASLDVAERAATAAEGRRLDAQAIGERQRRGETARTVLAELDASSEALAATAALVSQAERAALVAPHHAARDRARARLHGAEEAGSRIVSELWLDPDVTRGRVVDLERQVATWTDGLAAAQHAATEATTARARLVSHQAAAAEASTLLEVEQQRQASLERARTDAEARLVAFEETERRRVVLRNRHDQVSEVLWVADELGKAQTAATRLAGEHRDARDEELAAHETYLTRRQSRLDEMAAELAGRLEPGDPCPVCGGLDHPALATPSGGAVTAGQVDAAERVWHEHATRREAVAAQLASVTSLVDTRTDDLDRQVELARLENVSVDLLPMDASSTASAPSPDEASSSRVDVRRWRMLLRVVDEALRDLGEGPRGGEELQAQLLHAREEAVQQSQKVARLERQVAVAHAVVAEVTAAVESAHARMLVALADHRDCSCAGLGAQVPSMTNESVGLDGDFDLQRVSLAMRHHAEVSDLLSALAGRLLSVEEATAELAESQDRLVAALAAHGFTDAETAAGFVRSATEVAALKEQLHQADSRRAVAENVLADPDVASALELPAADETVAAQTLLEARQRHRVAQGREVTARQTHHQLITVADSLGARATALGPLRQRAELVADLAEAVTGVGADNVLRMRLSSFVLAARLEKVALLANERLAVMGDGRYQLQHSDDLASGRRRSGLGLVVRDLWTGVVRDTSTLSGGESFMASLALALGLADAVREESGGFDLQTLFIDEGFGTLDDESLEQVLDVLDGLREGGRCVGVVSHVGDLLARIPTQICVSKTQTGSTVATRGGQVSAA